MTALSMNDGIKIFANKEKFKRHECNIFADMNDKVYNREWKVTKTLSFLPRHCGNNCEPVASRMSRSCVCRKRKEHEEDFYEADWKFSKSSDRSCGDGNSMIRLMKKWSNNDVVKGEKGEEGPVVQQDSDYKVRVLLRIVFFIYFYLEII